MTVVLLALSVLITLCMIKLVIMCVATARRRQEGLAHQEEHQQEHQHNIIVEH